MAKPKITPNGRRGMNPVLAQISQEKFLEKKLRESFQEGARAGAANMILIATALYDSLIRNSCDGYSIERVQTFYETLKDCVKKDMVNIESADKLYETIQKTFTTQLSKEDFIKIDSSLAGIFGEEKPEGVKKPTLIGSKNGITVPAPDQE